MRLPSPRRVLMVVLVVLVCYLGSEHYRHRTVNMEKYKVFIGDTSPEVEKQDPSSKDHNGNGANAVGVKDNEVDISVDVGDKPNLKEAAPNALELNNANLDLAEEEETDDVELGLYPVQMQRDMQRILAEEIASPLRDDDTPDEHTPTRLTVAPPLGLGRKGRDRIEGAGNLTGLAKSNLLQIVDRGLSPLTGESCKPVTRIMYLKTHKTGSSTLTNLFHRAAVRLRSRVVLPKSDVFLGWPDSRSVLDSYSPIPDVDKYDMFISAHARYNKERISKILPGAERVTVLRSPVSHFMSSFEYWSVAAHIEAKSGLKVTKEKVLSDPDFYLGKERGLKSDRDLIVNSQAFDLGLSRSSSKAEVKALIEDLKTWKMVLITDFMDESLVVLSHKLCWSLENVAYFGLKRRSKKGRPPVAEDTVKKIESLNWMDKMLYSYFNDSLWRETKKIPDFDLKLKKLRELNDDASESCNKTASYSEDQHRRAMIGETGPKTVEQMECHLMQLDSPGFVKYLKHIAGVFVEECPTQAKPVMTIGYVVDEFSECPRLRALLHRFTIKRHLRPAIPVPQQNLHYLEPFGRHHRYVVKHERISDDLLNLSLPISGNRLQKSYDTLVSGYTSLQFKPIWKTVPGAEILAMLRDPVAHFLKVWSHADVVKAREKLGSAGATLESFFQDPLDNFNLLPANIRNKLRNSQSQLLGVKPGASPEDINADIETIRKSTRLVLIHEHLDESFVALRRMFCWDMSDFTILDRDTLLQTDTIAQQQAELSESLKKAIRKFNYIDDVLYNAFNTTLWDRIATQIRFQDELVKYRRERAKKEQQCSDIFRDLYGKPTLQNITSGLMELFVQRLVPPPQLVVNSLEFDCHVQAADFKAINDILKHMWAIKHIPAKKKKKQSVKKKRSRKQCSLNKFLLIASPRGVHTEPFVSFAYRGAVKYNLTTIAVNSSLVRWDKPESLFKNIVWQSSASIMAEPFVRYDPHLVRRLVSDEKAVRVLVIEEPTTMFYSLWSRIHKRRRPLPSMLEFFDDYDEYGREKFNWLRNPQTFDLFGVRDPTVDQLTEMKAILEKEFYHVLIANRPSESLFLLQNTLCWNPDDAIDISPKAPVLKKGGVLARIRRFQYADQELFEHFEKILLDVINEEGLTSGAFGLRKSMDSQPCKNYADLKSKQKKLVSWLTTNQFPAYRSDNSKAMVNITLSEDGCKPLLLSRKSLREIAHNMPVIK
eukprot:m.119916 g.119916  ORF g.119916 m.119916 type:complete len:1220 (+) comp14338_c0_seq1:89-3748(+)